MESGRGRRGRGRGGFGGGFRREGGFSDQNGQRSETNNWRSRDETETSSESTELYVDQSLVGRIIGKGGSKIRELQDTSGANIKVNSREVEDGKVRVVISGSQDSCSQAEDLIKEITETFNGLSAGDGWGGGGRSGGRRGRDDGDNSDGGGRKTSCYKCGEEGHFARDCPNSDTYQQGGGGRKTTCYKCGEEGHIARDCSGSQSSSQPRRGFGDNGSSSGGSSVITENTEEPEKPKINWGIIRAAKEANEAKKFEGLPPLEKNFYFEHPSVANMRPEEAHQISVSVLKGSVCLSKRIMESPLDDTVGDLATKAVSSIADGDGLSIQEVHATESKAGSYGNIVELTTPMKENNNIIVDGGDKRVANPVRTFEEAFEHYPEILQQIYNQKFTEPSPIQKQAWPILLQGLDLIGIAQTGTGKTLAFLLPALIHIDNQPVPREQRGGPNVLVLSPTRELAQQIEVEVKKINYRGIRSVVVYGGGSRREQIKVVTKGVEIIVATPGRLNDLIMNGIIDVKSVTYLVLDEADRMLDMGFEPEIRKILLDIRRDRQTVMTSATWPQDVQRLADMYMTNPINIFVGTLDLAACHSVTQLVEMIDDEDKKDRLYDFLRYDLQPTDKVICFVGKKVLADDLSSDLAMEGIQCQCIHGDREQCDREAALSEFKSGEVRILIATDVASRGLDVKDITHVFNYDFPRNIEEYVHRIGRTGRAGNTGTSITLVTRGDWRQAQKLIDIMAEADQEIPENLIEMAERYQAHRERMASEGGGFGGRGGRGGRGRGGGFGGGGRRGGGFGGGRRGDDDGFIGGGFGGGYGGGGRSGGGRRDKEYNIHAGW